jgi:mannose/fructose/N-acetylgalactosamine-specific phosphotransferase system component IID
MEKTRQLSKKDLEMAQKCGGSEIKTWHEYYQPDNLGYSMKMAHLLRSIYWRKQLKEQKRLTQRQK